MCNVQTHRFALHPLSGQRTGGNSRATAKGFEPGVHDLPLVVHLNLSTFVKFNSNPSPITYTYITPPQIMIVIAKSTSRQAISYINHRLCFPKKRISREMFYSSKLNNLRLFSIYSPTWLLCISALCVDFYLC